MKKISNIPKPNSPRNTTIEINTIGPATQRIMMIHMNARNIDNPRPTRIIHHAARTSWKTLTPYSFAFKK